MHKFIGLNNLKEVTDPIFFERGFVPTANGLLSTEIFGITQRDRQENFAFINLHGVYLSPFIYKMIRRMNKNFDHVVNGTKTFIIDKDGQLVEDEKGKTGVKFLYDNWEKLKFNKNDSNIRTERIDLLETHEKDYLFVKYWDVIPAFYRDVNLQAGTGNPSKHEINDMYARLIRLAATVRDGALFDFTLYAVQAKIQNTLVEIYDNIKNRIEKKHGLIRKSLLGKSIDYGSRLVITAPTFETADFNETKIDFFHAGVPLAHCCSLFTPFVIGWVTNYFRQMLEATGNKFPKYDKDGKLETTFELEEPAIAFSEEVIKKALNRYVHSPANRFDPIYAPVKESSLPDKYKGKKFPLVMAGRHAASGGPEDKSPLMSRPLTWTDIFYQACVDITEDKVVWITRYPLLDYFGMFPVGIHVLSTMKTEAMYVGERLYEDYPVVDSKMNKTDMTVFFSDTLKMSNLYLAGLDGDYDGDQVTVKAPFSQEANAEAMKLMRSKSHILNISGNNMRKTTNEGIQTLYNLTK